MKNSRYSIIAPIVIAISVVLGIWIGVIYSRNSEQARTRQQVLGTLNGLQDNKLSYVLSLVKELYVDEVDTDSIVEDLMPELMAHLDPHSVYIPAEEMGDANEALDGEFDGIGVVFNMATDTVVVLNVINNGPSYKAGVMAGDRIVIIDGDTVAGRKMPQNDVVKKLRGKRGTKVDVMVLRNDIKDLVPIEIIRDKIPINSIDAAFMIAPEIGFIKLSAFAKTSYQELVTALNMLKKQGMKGLIFDLRENSGGFLDQAIQIANEFLPSGELIVYTEDRNGQQVRETSNGGGHSSDVNLVVMIDEYSASSSEILAGAIQDNDRGTIVGRRSFGKGLVQRQIPFSDGSAIRLTIARYYTPTGRSIQKPYTLGQTDYNEDIYNRYMNNEFFSADSIHFADSLKFTTPKGKTVYGGGGIMPDIFVPLDTLDITPYYNEVWGRNILYKFTLKYVDDHRKQINRLKTVAELNAMLDGDKNLLNDFIAYARQNGVEPNAAQIEKSKKILIAQLRAYIGRNTPLEDVGFYSNIYVVDNVLLKAIETLRNM